LLSFGAERAGASGCVRRNGESSRATNLRHRNNDADGCRIQERIPLPLEVIPKASKNVTFLIASDFLG
jgi:hypothetical protein